MTLEQVKKDIESGISKKIYYSAQTLWWTHLAEHLEESTPLGKEAMKESIGTRLQDESIPESQRMMMKAHLQKIDDSPMPMDPSGCPLLEIDNAALWIEEAEKNPDFFGEFKLEAFIKAHHSNCNNWCPTSWGAINEYMKLKKETEE